MGDLNARIPSITGDKGIEHSNAQGVKLQNLLKDTDMSVCVNQAQQDDNTHWTYVNPTEEVVRRSVPDYILYPRTSRNLCNSFKVHQNVSCGSFHRLLTVRLNQTIQATNSTWDPNISKSQNIDTAA